jgi:hypothetical protein
MGYVYGIPRLNLVWCTLGKIFNEKLLNTSLCVPMFLKKKYGLLSAGGSCL